MLARPRLCAREGKANFNWAVGLIGGGKPTISSIGNESLLNIIPKDTYNIEIKLKCEDKDNITIEKKKKFKIKITDK